MCFAAAGLIAAVASTALGVAQAGAQYQAAVQRSEQQTQMYFENQRNALAAGRDAHKQLTLRQMQEQDALAAKEHVMLVEQAEKESEALVSAAGANVEGLSTNALVADVIRKTTMNRTNAKINYENIAMQLQAEQDAVVNKTQSRINSVAPGADVDAAPYLLGAVGSGINAFSKVDFKSM